MLRLRPPYSGSTGYGRKNEIGEGDDPDRTGFRICMDFSK
jgi:hypothetical protein